MPPAILPHSAYQAGGSPRSRATAFVLALAITALMVLMLIELGTFTPVPTAPALRSIAIDLPPSDQATRSHSVVPVKRNGGGGSPRKTAPPTPTPAHAPPPPVVPAPPAWNVIPMTSQEFASSDIASKPSHRAGPDQGGEGTSGSGAGPSSGDDDGAGKGPGGDTLYNAEWYVEPTHAQMVTYLPHNGLTGWGMIACRTVEKYHVEDCKELDESPAGSGISRALRQAAWQFLVRPPRVNGKPLIGAWVRIRFDVTVNGRDGGDR